MVDRYTSENGRLLSKKQKASYQFQELCLIANLPDLHISLCLGLWNCIFGRDVTKLQKWFSQTGVILKTHTIIVRTPFEINYLIK